MKRFLVFWPNTSSYRKENNNECKKAIGKKKYVLKGKPKFQDYNNCFKASQIMKKLNCLEKKRNNID